MEPAGALQGCAMAARSVRTGKVIQAPMFGTRQHFIDSLS